MRKRRGRGEGSIYQRRDGTWVASVRLGYDGARSVRSTAYAKSKQEAQSKLLALQREAASGSLALTNSVTFHEFTARWFCDYVRVRCRPSTYELYETLVRLHVLPYIMPSMPLSKVSPGQVQALYSRLEAKGCSPRLRQMVHARLHKIFASAIKWRLINFNPCDAVEVPRAASRTMQHLDPGECKELLLAAKEEPLYALYALAIGTGLRQGELFGLKWEDVDFRSGTVSVQRSVQEIGGRPVVQEPKTAQSKRMVVLPSFVAQALRVHRKANLVEGRGASEWVFCDSAGGLLRKSNVTRRSFKPLLKRAGLPNIRFHDLRHTAATLLLGQGTNPKIVQEMLGHARISLTLDTYSHVTPSMQHAAAEALDAILA